MVISGVNRSNSRSIFISGMLEYAYDSAVLTRTDCGVFVMSIDSNVLISDVRVDGCRLNPSDCLLTIFFSCRHALPCTI